MRFQIAVFLTANLAGRLLGAGCCSAAVIAHFGSLAAGAFFPMGFSICLKCIGILVADNKIIACFGSGINIRLCCANSNCHRTRLIYRNHTGRRIHRSDLRIAALITQSTLCVADMAGLQHFLARSRSVCGVHCELLL